MTDDATDWVRSTKPTTVTLEGSTKASDIDFFLLDLVGRSGQLFTMRMMLVWSEETQFFTMSSTRLALLGITFLSLDFHKLWLSVMSISLFTEFSQQ